MVQANTGLEKNVTARVWGIPVELIPEQTEISRYGFGGQRLKYIGDEFADGGSRRSIFLSHDQDGSQPYISRVVIPHQNDAHGTSLAMTAAVETRTLQSMPGYEQLFNILFKNKR